MRYLLLALLLGGLEGCANSGQFLAVQQVAADAAAKVADEQLTLGIYMICKAPTVGAWTRKFGSDASKSAAWRNLCAEPVTETPTKAN